MKRIFVIATGGTIAGVGEAGGRRYRSGELSVAALLESVPGLAALAQIETHQLANIGSQDMSEALWFDLAALVTQKLSSADCDGVVIIHGTDTMEETAFFLHCVLPQTAKPVVLTGAMRPATALSPDGPHNLFAAVAVAASDASAHRGVLVVFADQIFSAANVAKIHTRNLDAFCAGTRGSGAVFGSVTQAAAGSRTGVQVIYHLPSAAVSASVTDEPSFDKGARLETLPITGLLATLSDPAQPLGHSSGKLPHGAAMSPCSALPRVDLGALAAAGALPKVAIATAYVGQSADGIEALVQLGYRGIVVAGLGNGNFSATVLAALKAAQQRGVVVVRASRVPLGGVTACGEVDDAAYGFICGGAFTPQQARILLALALAQGSTDVEQIRNWFASCGTTGCHTT